MVSAAAKTILGRYVGDYERRSEVRSSGEAVSRVSVTEPYMRRCQAIDLGGRAVNEIQVSRESCFFIKSKTGGNERTEQENPHEIRRANQARPASERGSGQRDIPVGIMPQCIRKPHVQPKRLR